MVRSVGFYPSEEEVANMVNEVSVSITRNYIVGTNRPTLSLQVRYKNFITTGETQDVIGLVSDLNFIWEILF